MHLMCFAAVCIYDACNCLLPCTAAAAACQVVCGSRRSCSLDMTNPLDSINFVVANQLGACKQICCGCGTRVRARVKPNVAPVP
jgi:hypothetical protein